MENTNIEQEVQIKNADTETAEEQVYSEDEVQKLIAEATKGMLDEEQVNEVVEKRLARDREKREKEQRLSEMDEKERSEALLKDLQEQLEAEKEEKQRILLEQDTIEVLNNEGLPIGFKSFLMQENAETTNENIKTFKAEFNKAVQEEVEKRLVGKTPKASTPTQSADVWSQLKDKYK